MHSLSSCSSTMSSVHAEQGFLSSITYRSGWRTFVVMHWHRLASGGGTTMRSTTNQQPKVNFVKGEHKTYANAGSKLKPKLGYRRKRQRVGMLML